VSQPEVSHFCFLRTFVKIFLNCKNFIAYNIAECNRVKKTALSAMQYAHLQCNRITLLTVTTLMASLHNEALLQFYHNEILQKSFFFWEGATFLTHTVYMYMYIIFTSVNKNNLIFSARLQSSFLWKDGWR